MGGDATRLRFPLLQDHSHMVNEPLEALSLLDCAITSGEISHWATTRQ